MERRFGLGLRAQIVFALTAAFVLAFTLLGVAVVQLAERARTFDRARGAEDVARVIASAAPALEGDRRAAVSRLADAARAGRLVSGVSVEWDGTEPHARGLVGAGDEVAVPFPDGRGTVRVWIRPPAQRDSAPLANLVLLYVATTGGVILLLAFVSLTYLIVRPVEAVTRASERLAQGDMRVEVPVRGAAEVARLAVAFNAMAAQLRGERQALEERVHALERTTAELERARDHLVRSERLASVGRLSAGVAHEIGNPLAAIHGLVELLLDDDGAAGLDRAELLRRARGETERIQKTIRDLLDFSRQERESTAELMDGEATTDLASVVEDAVRLVEPQKSLRDVRIERQEAAGVPPVRGARDALTQVVVNLLINAADAVDGRGTIRIALRSSSDPPGVCLDIEDDGPGIAPGVAAHLFEPFVTTKPPGKGTGLGLAVSHTLVRRMGGTLEAGASEALGGARFTVRLQAASSSDRA